MRFTVRKDLARSIHRLLLLHSALLVRPGRAWCQDLEPRAYAANPIGVRFAVAAFVHTTGNVVLDPTSPVSDVRATLHSVVLGAGGTFAIVGRSASASVAVPYAWGTVSGNVAETDTSVDRAGLADARLRVAVSLVGGQAVPLAAFARRTPGTIVGISLTTAVPTGQYFPDKLINLGTNRWGFKPEVGVSYPAGPWTLELYAGSWFFTRNSSYWGGHTKDVRPLMSVQSHVAYTFRPRLWLAADVTFYTGGRSVVDGQPATEREANTRVGLTLSVPVWRIHSIKAAWSTGAVVRLGGDFDTFILTWQTTMLPGLR